MSIITLWLSTIVVNYMHNWIAGVRNCIKDNWIMDIITYKYSYTWLSMIRLSISRYGYPQLNYGKIQNPIQQNLWKLFDTSVFICLVDNWSAEIMLLYLFRYEIMKNVMILISSHIGESLATTVCTNATNIINAISQLLTFTIQLHQLTLIEWHNTLTTFSTVIVHGTVYFVMNMACRRWRLENHGVI